MRPVVGLMEIIERVTVPAKLKVLVTVMVLEFDSPAGKKTLAPLMEKSPTWTVALAECEALPGKPFPVTAAK